MLPVFSSHMKDNVDVIRFYVKSRGEQGLLFVQIMFETNTRNFYFENGEVGRKMTIVNLQPLLPCNASACLCIFMQPRIFTFKLS